MGGWRIRGSVSHAYLLVSRVIDARDFDGARLIRRARGEPAQRLARQIDRAGDADEVARASVGKSGGQRLRRADSGAISSVGRGLGNDLASCSRRAARGIAAAVV